MNWIGLRAGKKLLRARELAECPPGNELRTGSLVLEVDTGQLCGHFVNLVDYRDTDNWRHSIRVRLALSGHLSVQVENGTDIFGAELSFGHMDSPTVLRITVSWDADRGIGFVAAGLPEHHVWFDKEIRVSFAPRHADLLALVHSEPGGDVCPCVRFIAISRIMEPIGALPTLAAGTPVATATGYRPIETIRVGDLVQTYQRGLQPVRACVSRSLPALGWCSPVLLPAPHLGLHRTLMVTPDHHLMIESLDAEYLFGAARVFVRADQLSAYSLGQPVIASRTVSMHQIVFDRHEIIRTAGCWSESMFTGGFDVPGRSIRNTVLDPRRAGRLPEHRERAEAVLRDYEASVLLSELAS